MSKAMILIVEDDKHLSHINRHALESEGYDVQTAFTLEEARTILTSVSPDIILLDVKLPDGTGFDLCREIRGDTDAYIIFLTSVQESSGEMEGLVAGGDDYLRKPYDIDLLCERVKKGLRHERKASQIIRRGSLTFDIIALRADMNGRDLLLAGKEFSILLLLIENEGQAMSAEYLYEKVWKLPMNNDSQSVRSVVMRLRKKLEDSGFTVNYDKSNNSYYFGADGE
jgi:DNA-binding response OmpR family regulator